MTQNRVYIILLWIVRATAIGLTLFVLYTVFNLYFFPVGKLDVTYDFSEDSQYISHLGPWQRVTPPTETGGTWSQDIKDDLVYFDIKNPRWFQTVTVEMTFQNANQPIFEIGARVDKKDNYRSLPLQNRLFDDLGWNRIQEGEATLWQKNKRFDTIDDFEKNVTDADRIGKYFYDYRVDRIISNYAPATAPTVIDHALRGGHTLYTYLKDEDLDFQFVKTDLNRYAGSDSVTIDVYRQKTGEKIYTQTIADDGDEGINGVNSAQTGQIRLSGLSEGVYRLVISGNNDFIINSITTAQKYVVFYRNLFPADNEEYISDIIPGGKPTLLVTDSMTLRFKTDHPAGLQTVTAGTQKVNIAAVNTYYGVQLAGLSTISIPQNDVLIEGSGLFAFSEGQYFYPFPLNVTNVNTETDINSLDFIISNYIPPVVSGDWLVKAQAYDIDSLYRDDQGKIRFRLSAPGLSARGGSIRISKIRVVFEKPPLTWDNFRDRLMNFAKRTVKKWQEQ